MRRFHRRNILGAIVLSAILISGLSWIWFRSRPTGVPQATGQIMQGLSDPVDVRFKRAEAPRTFSFPTDHGPHPDYQTEWWYYTGNLASSDGHKWGYQLTFFRRGLTPDPVKRASEWGTNTVYLAHFTVTDGNGKRFFAYDKTARGGNIGLAGATADPYHVFVENWSVEGTGETGRLRASAEQAAIDLNFHSLTKVVLQGEDGSGLSQKGPERGNASYYYSLPRLATNGTITVAGKPVTVEGLSWMDHEYSTNALNKQQVGWDWFGLHLDDGRNVMWGQLRRPDGSIDVAHGSISNANGLVQPLKHDAVQVTVLDTWTSHLSGARYPAHWRVQISSVGIDLDITPLISDQELRLSQIIYWEGAVQIRGSATGNGYVELTGYAPGIQQVR